MKRVKGFTLAEILITLGIIGVVAALTAPALVQNAGNAKIGPALQKIKTTLEVANQQILYDNSISDLTSLTTYDISDSDSDWEAAVESATDAFNAYCYYLSKSVPDSYYGNFYQAGNAYYRDGSTAFSYSKDSSNDIVFTMPGGAQIFFQWYKSQNSVSNGSYKGLFVSFVADINGFGTGPNVMGKDLFWFVVDRSGAVVPHGSHAANFAYGQERWDVSGTGNTCMEDDVSDYGYGCAGSVFDNNLKVVYQ